MPFFESEWVKKERTMAWKLKSCVIWSALCSFGWMCGFFLLFRLLSGSQDLPQESAGLGGRIGGELGRLAGCLWGAGCSIILSRPRKRKTSQRENQSGDQTTDLVASFPERPVPMFDSNKTR